MDDINSLLIDDFTKPEVDIVLKQMAPLKAFGPNGMPHIFFLALLALTFLNSGQILVEINYKYSPSSTT